MRLPQTIAGTIESIARSAVGKDWALYATLLNHWAEIVGQDYAKVTTPVKITFPQGKKADEKWAQGRRTGGILTISLPQGLAMEFSFLSETMLTRINGFFGYPAIGKIALEPYYKGDPKPSALPIDSDELSTEPRAKEEVAAIEEQLKDMENKELKEALLNLGLRLQKQD